MVRKQNPYHGAGQPATGDRFVGRADLVRQLRDTWPPGKRPANVEVLGPHRIGKTSLVKRAMAQAKDETLCFVELTVGTGPGDDLFTDMVQQVVQRGPARIVKNRAVARAANQVTGAPHWNAVVTPVRDFFELVSGTGLRVVLVLDSFDNARHTLDKHHYMTLKQLCSSVGVVTLSRRPVVEIEGRALGSEFFLMFNLDHRVGLFDDAEVDLMLARAEPLGIDLRSVRGQLVDRAGHHPYLLELLCYRIIGDHLDGKELNVETAFQASRTKFFDQFGSVIKLLRERVNTDPVVLLQQVAAGKATDYTPILEDIGLLRPRGNGSRLFSTSFEEYVYRPADTPMARAPAVPSDDDRVQIARRNWPPATNTDIQTRSAGNPGRSAHTPRAAHRRRGERAKPTAETRSGPGPEDEGRRTIKMGFGVDIVDYSRRSSPDRDDAQQRLATMIRNVLNTELTIRLDDVDHQATGDGMNVFLPQTIEMHQALPRLLRSWREHLARDNQRYRDRLRLRVAFAVGPTGVAPLGFAGNTIVEVHRLLNSDVLRQAIIDHPDVDLAVLVSDQLHRWVVGEGYPGLDRAQFQRVKARVKDFSAPAWLWVAA
jgi:hypothetical protein